MATARIFLSYRREDSSGYAGRLFDALVAAFGDESVFMDIDTIAPGADFVQVIEAALRGCDVALVLIGPNWLSAADRRRRRRLDKPEDFVRLEIAEALNRGIRVLPVLVGGAEMPESRELPSTIAGLSRRHAFELSDRRWHADVRELVVALRSGIAETQAAAVNAVPPPPVAPETARPLNRAPPVKPPPAEPPVNPHSDVAGDLAGSRSPSPAASAARVESAALLQPQRRIARRSASLATLVVAEALAATLIIVSAIGGGNYGAYESTTIGVLAAAALATAVGGVLQLVPFVPMAVRAAAILLMTAAGCVAFGVGATSDSNLLSDTPYGQLLDVAGALVLLVSVAATVALLTRRSDRRPADARPMSPPASS